MRREYKVTQSHIVNSRRKIYISWLPAVEKLIERALKPPRLIEEMGLCTSAEQGDYEIIHQYDGDKFLCYRHGEGTYHYSNGDRYKGQWKWNKMHGHGVYTHLSGDM